MAVGLTCFHIEAAGGARGEFVWTPKQRSPRSLGEIGLRWKSLRLDLREILSQEMGSERVLRIWYRRIREETSWRERNLNQSGEREGRWMLQKSWAALGAG
jgi:hypothetical protein